MYAAESEQKLPALRTQHCGNSLQCLGLELAKGML
jgi:hypothetical protein